MRVCLLGSDRQRHGASETISTTAVATAVEAWADSPSYQVGTTKRSLHTVAARNNNEQKLKETTENVTAMYI